MKKSIDQFTADCMAVVNHYKGDIEHDRAIIRAGTPAIFAAGEMGTHAITMPHLYKLPAYGVRVPYLFGTADAWHIVSQVGVILECESVRACTLWHFFDGQTIREINQSEASELCDRYKRTARAYLLRRDAIQGEAA